MRKKILLLALCFATFTLSLAAQDVAEATPEATAEGQTDIYMPEAVEDIPEGWTLVWNDEFSGTEIDRSKWGFDTGGGGFGNNEQQFYTDKPENVYLEDNNLVIQALEGRYMGAYYTSTKLQTLVLGEWQYGRIDIRARLPIGQGIWPAFWMLPARGNYGSWPSGGEIDIMEYLGHEPQTVHGTLHYGASGDHQFSGTSYTLEEGSFADDYHIFSIIWEAESIRWFVDGIEYQEQTEWYTGIADYPAPFDQKFYLIINLAVGGNWPGYPDETTVFPQRMMVDYVRLYQTETDE
jgi:beta-glucanase (GH16 family)